MNWSNYYKILGVHSYFSTTAQCPDPSETVDESLQQPEVNEVPEELIDEPVVEEPVAKEQVAKEQVAKEPVAEEPVAKEQVAEEPIETMPEEEPLHQPMGDIQPEVPSTTHSGNPNSRSEHAGMDFGPSKTMSIPE